MDTSDEDQNMLIMNKNDFTVTLAPGRTLGTLEAPGDEESELTEALAFLRNDNQDAYRFLDVDSVPEETIDTNKSPTEAASTRPRTKLQPKSLASTKSDIHVKSEARISHVLKRWLLVVLLLLQSTPPLQVVQNNKQQQQEITEIGSASRWMYEDLTSEEYRTAVLEQFEKQKSEYAHLTENQWQLLCSFVARNAETFYIEGAKPTTVLGFEFDVQLHEGAKPVKAPLPRYSAEQAKKEQHHIKSAMDMGHLITPEPEDIGPWATATHVVFKKDSDWGRLICDFRALNKATIPMPISISDVRDQVRNVAQKLWKSLFDALHGFNQISASKSARKLLQIQSSLGLKQWSVMPFGVINGPSVYQNMMQQVFAKYMSGTDEKWQTLDSSLSFFMDDGCLGTGDIDLCKNLNEGNKSFERHIEALDLVMSCARGHRLRFLNSVSAVSHSGKYHS